MKNTFILGMIALALFTVSCGDGDKKIVAEDTEAVKVSVNSVAAESGNSFLTASGKIEAVNSANLSTRMMGFVDRIYVNVGDKVKKGQQLISIADTDLSAKLAQVNAGITEATAAFTNAEKDYNRFTALFAENSASQKELDDITAHYNMAKARLEGAEQMKNEVNAQFSYANIRAPFSGTVTNKFINVGDMANPGMPLIAIESPGNYEVTAMIPESEISKIKSGTAVDILIKSMNETVKGKVTEVSSSAKNTGGQYLVKAILEHTDANILSGMFATVQFPVSRESDTVAMTLIPKSALVENGGLKGVYTISDQDRALLRWLRLGKTYGEQVEVLSGLSSDEQYIISAEGKLFNGAKVTLQ
ncbi:MAG: efflux RND transporter periplasmic adaptor subunit [Maribacter sp.]|uniref:efflux RND transporter periplasmic adaptor subunit n=1 Tax=Maribacter sp. TaxID=1897614 RepID=UPI003C72909A